MKKFYLLIIFIVFCLSNLVVKSQDLIWDAPDAGLNSDNHTVGFQTGSMTLNGDFVTQEGALIGAFYINESGDLTCGGYYQLESDEIMTNSIAFPAWITSPGQDTGFEIGEEMNFYLNIGATCIENCDATGDDIINKVFIGGINYLANEDIVFFAVIDYI